MFAYGRNAFRRTDMCEHNNNWTNENQLFEDKSVDAYRICYDVDCLNRCIAIFKPTQIGVCMQRVCFFFYIVRMIHVRASQQLHRMSSQSNHSFSCLALKMKPISHVHVKICFEQECDAGKSILIAQNTRVLQLCTNVMRTHQSNCRLFVAKRQLLWDGYCVCSCSNNKQIFSFSTSLTTQMGIVTRSIMQNNISTKYRACSCFNAFVHHHFGFRSFYFGLYPFFSFIFHFMSIILLYISN